MITARNINTAAISALQTAHDRVVVHVADVLLPVSLILWAVGIRRTNVSVLGPYGLLPDLPIVFYAGVALLVVSAAAELSHREPSKWRMGLHAVALVAMLYGTAPLLYPEGRYSWLYKTVGVVQYVNAHGHVDISIDIYQNWPGFFALMAWFTKVAGLGSPLAYAKWAQLLYELAALPLLYLIYDALKLTNRQRWVAILLYSASNWIGQDYFSPQATGTVLSLGIMALAVRWLYTPQSARVPGWHWLSARLPGWWHWLVAHVPRWDWLRVPPIPAERPAAGPWPSGRRGTAVVVAVVLLYAVLTFTHELTPYIVAVQLGALAVVGALRPRWLPLALAAIAIGYLAPHWSFVNSHFGLLKTLGDLFRNVTPPAFKVAASASQHVIEVCSEALSFGIWALAGLGAWLRRRAGQDALPLVLLAYSPVVVLTAQAYGNEGILRVFLFSLPWSAALGACALLPLRKPGREGVQHLQTQGQDRPVAPPRTRRRLRALRPAAGLAVALILFFPAFFGDDAFNVMRAPEVTTIKSFLTHAPGGTLYVAIGHGPFADTSRYNEFPLRQIFGAGGLLHGKPATPEIAGILSQYALRRPGAAANRPAYVIVAPSMIAYSQAYQTTTARNFSVLRASLARSPFWKLVSNDDAGTVIYELAPVSLPPGIHG